jgi:FkbH-like protein
MNELTARRGHFFMAQESILKIHRNRKFITSRKGDERFNSEVHIIRNEAWEPYLEHSANIAAKMDIKIEFSLSPYDDTLNSILGSPLKPNYIIWFNWSRVQTSSIHLLFDRISDAKRNHASSNWYLVMPSHWTPEVRTEVSLQAELHGWLTDQIIDFIDFGPGENPPKLGFTRSELDFISFKLGTYIAMGCSDTRIRALVVDLDNTLYKGVIGEDSPDEICVTESHLQLQQFIADISYAGVLVFIATKNNPSDVDLAFELNFLPRLPRSRITSVFSGWNEKSKSMTEIISLLNFSERNILFIDDNGRELTEMAASCPDVLTLSAFSTEQLLSALRGAISFQIDKSNSADVRIKDIQARALRGEVLSSGMVGPKLLTSLNTKIHSINVSEEADLNRANELFSKTNQFNFSLNRTKVDLEQLNSHFGVVNTSLKDDISDSGTISSICWAYQSDTLNILEFVISCRALGRETERYILKSALLTFFAEKKPSRVVARFLEGARNQPSHDFLRTYFQIDSEGWHLDWDKLNEDTAEIGKEIIV